MKIDDKIRVFGHYLFCQVKSKDTTITMQSIDANTGCAISPDNSTQLFIEECKLQLRDLKCVTRKEALVCAALANLPSALVNNWQLRYSCSGEAIFSFPDEGEGCNYRNMIIFREDKLNWQQVDYLRSRGYAIGIPKEIYDIMKVEVTA